MIEIAFLHNKIAAIVPIFGVSDSLRADSPGTRRVDFRDEATPEQREMAEAMADGWDTLSVTADKTTIQVSSLGAAETDPAKIANISSGNLQTFRYTINGGDEQQVNDGTLEFIALTAGVYLIEIIDEYNTGYIEIEVIDD